MTSPETSPAGAEPSQANNASAAPSAGARDGSRVKRLGFLALCALASLPVWLTARPPMVDLPQHAAQITILGQLFHGDWQLANLFQTNFFIPYLLAYAIAFPLAQAFGVTVALKLVISAALILFPLSTAYLLKRYKADPMWGLLVIPASYGFAFTWGQLNFIVAAPIGIALLALASRFARKPSLALGLGLAALTHVLFFSHILILFFFGGLAGLVILRHARSIGRAAHSLIPLLSLAPTGLAWGLPAVGNPQFQWPIRWDHGWFRLIELPETILGVPFSVSAAFIITMLFALPLLAGLRLSRDPERLVPFVLCALIVAWAPNALAGDYFIYQRFALLLLPLYLLTLEAAPDPSAKKYKFAQSGAILLTCCWIGLISLRFLAYQTEIRDFQPVLDRMEPDKRVLSLVFERESYFSTAPIYLHYPVWYQAEKHGLVDFNFASFQKQVVQYRLDAMPPADSSFVWHPEAFDWEHYRVEMYDYLVVRTKGGLAQSPLNLVNCQIELILRSGTWWLYQVNPTAVQEAGCPQRKP